MNGNVLTASLLSIGLYLNSAADLVTGAHFAFAVSAMFAGVAAIIAGAVWK